MKVAKTKPVLLTEVLNDNILSVTCSSTKVVKNKVSDETPSEIGVFPEEQFTSFSIL